jgi:aminoglycoside/choline kinase family phosphotransferase
VEVPAGPDGLTREWLTDALRANGALTRGRVTRVRIQQLGGEKGMTGQLARIHLDYDDGNEAAPRSLVAKFSSPDLRIRALVHSAGFYEREVRFYKQLAGRSPIHTPRCYFGAVQPSDGASLLLLEDLGGVGNGSWAAGCSVREAEIAVRAIASFHATWWQDPRLDGQRWLELPDVVSAEQAQVAVCEAWEPFLARLGPQVSAEVLDAGAWLRRRLGRLCAYLYQEAPRTVVHNDYQADNLFFPGAGGVPALTVVDWQVATRGRGVLDIAWLLGGNLDPADRRKHERDLLRTYHVQLVADGVPGYGLARCWDDYRLAMLHPISRIATTVGLGAVPADQERWYCNVLIPRYCRAAHDLAAGAAAAVNC